MKTHTLSIKEQYLVNKIAERSVKINPSLNFSKSYIITLFYYLMQYSGFKIDTIPNEYQEAVEDLYKNPSSSYIHYYNQIKESKNEYVPYIKKAEIEIIGGDPRCPW